MKNIQVGQIIFLLLKEDDAVIPAIVTEEITRKSLDNEEKKYFAKTLNSKSFFLDFNKYDVFMNIDDVRSYLLTAATTAIDKICEHAFIESTNFKNRENVFNLKSKNEMKQEVESRQPEYENSAQVVLEDGRLANIKIANF